MNFTSTNRSSNLLLRKRGDDGHRYTSDAEDPLLCSSFWSDRSGPCIVDRAPPRSGELLGVSYVFTRNRLCPLQNISFVALRQLWLDPAPWPDHKPIPILVLLITNPGTSKSKPATNYLRTSGGILGRKDMVHPGAVETV